MRSRELSNGGLRTMMNVDLPAVEDLADESSDDEFVLRRHELEDKALAATRRRASAPAVARGAPAGGAERRRVHFDVDDDSTIDDELAFNATRRAKQRSRSSRLERRERATDAARAAASETATPGRAKSDKRRKQIAHAQKLSGTGRRGSSGQASLENLEDFLGLGAALQELDVLDQRSFDRGHRIRRAPQPARRRPPKTKWGLGREE